MSKCVENSSCSCRAMRVSIQMINSFLYSKKKGLNCIKTIVHQVYWFLNNAQPWESVHTVKKCEFQMELRTHKTADIFTAKHHTLLYIHQPLLSGPVLHPQVRLIIPSPASLSWGACCQFIRLFLLISYFPQCKHPSPLSATPLESSEQSGVKPSDV